MHQQRQRGVALLEVIVTLAISAIVLGGTAVAYQSSIKFQTEMLPKRQEFDQIARFEKQLTSLIEKAFLSTDAGNTASFFTADIVAGEKGLGQTDLPDTLIFTAQGRPLPNAYVNADPELQFEDLNAQYGPIAGTAEISLSMAPVGDAGDRTGLFIREQVPADGDAFQGGYERVLDPNIEAIGFEFFTGLDWITEWDTTTGAVDRIPAAVRVRYRRVGDPQGTDRVFVVRLPMSNVTPENPVGEGGA